MAGLSVAVHALLILLPNLPKVVLLVLGNSRPGLRSMPAVAEIAALLVVLLEDRAVVRIVELVQQIVAPVLFRFL